MVTKPSFMRHNGTMTITHQTVIGENGEPSAVITPWDVFQKVRSLFEDLPTPDEAEAMQEAENDRRASNKEAFTDLDDLNFKKTTAYPAR